MGLACQGTGKDSWMDVGGGGELGWTERGGMTEKT